MSKILIEKEIFYEICARYIPDWRKVYGVPKLSDTQLADALNDKLQAMVKRAEYALNNTPAERGRIVTKEN